VKLFLTLPTRNDAKRGVPAGVAVAAKCSTGVAHNNSYYYDDVAYNGLARMHLTTRHAACAGAHSATALATANHSQLQRTLTQRFTRLGGARLLTGRCPRGDILIFRHDCGPVPCKERTPSSSTRLTCLGGAPAGAHSPCRPLGRIPAHGYLPPSLQYLHHAQLPSCCPFNTQHVDMSGCKTTRHLPPDPAPSGFTGELPNHSRDCARQTPRMDTRVSRGRRTAPHSTAQLGEALQRPAAG
jgi:hypothetical protein